MFEQAFKNIDNVVWKEAGCTTELDYTEQTSWVLFLKYLDVLETEKAMEAKLESKKYNALNPLPTKLAAIHITCFSKPSVQGYRILVLLS